MKIIKALSILMLVSSPALAQTNVPGSALSIQNASRAARAAAIAAEKATRLADLQNRMAAHKAARKR